MSTILTLKILYMLKDLCFLDGFGQTQFSTMGGQHNLRSIHMMGYGMYGETFLIQHVELLLMSPALLSTPLVEGGSLPIPETGLMGMIQHTDVTVKQLARVHKQLL